MRLSKRHILWTVPFVCFTLGYWLPYFLFTVPTLKVPNLLGKNVLAALETASHQNLSLKLLRTQEDQTVEVGTVLFQTPAPGRNVKPHQTILVVTSCQKKQLVTPCCIGLTVEEALAFLKAKDITASVQYVPTKTDHAKVLSQKPAPGSTPTKEGLTLYVGEPAQSTVIMPNCKGVSVTQALDFFRLHELTYEVQRSCGHDLTACSCIITEQRPLAGSYVDLKKSPTIVLSTKH